MLSRNSGRQQRHAAIGGILCLLAMMSIAWGQFGFFPEKPLQPVADEAAATSSGSPLEVDRKLKQSLILAEQYLAEGETTEALQLWQNALNRAKNTLTTREEWKAQFTSGDGEQREYTIYRSITGEIERRLGKLPPAELRLYRQNFDPDAALTLQKNTGENRVAALEEVVSQYFLSSHGDESAYYLAMLWFDQGDYARSARMLQKILSDYPDSTISPKQIRLRLALTSARMRDLASAQKYWAEYQDLSDGKVPESVRLIYNQELARAAKPPVPQGTNGESWPMQYGSPARNKDMPVLPSKTLERQLSEGWDRPFENQLEQTPTNNTNNTRTLVLAGGQVVQVARSSSGQVATVARKPLDREWRDNGWFPARQLYFDQGRIYINANNRLICCSAEDGRVLWMGRRYQYEPDQTTRYYAALLGNAVQNTGRSPITIPEIRLFGDRLHPQLTIHEGTAYALEGELLDWGTEPRPDNTQITSYNMRRARQNWLSAYDARTGKLKWVRSPSDLGQESPEAPMGFLAAPVPFGDRLLIPVSHKGELWLYSLIEKTGQTDWKVFLWDEPLDGVSPWSGIGTVIEGGDIYLATGMGLVFALDAATGKVHWANQYPRKGIRPSANMRGFNPSAIANASKIGWMEDVVIPTGNQLVVLPTDYDYIVTLDRRTGDLLWDSHQSPFEGDPRATYGLGVSGDGLFVGGPDVLRKYDVPSGKLIWEQSIDKSLGQAALTADAIYAPSEDSILQIDPATGKVLGKTNVFTPTGEPVGNLFSDGTRLYGVGMQRIYSLASLTERMALLEKRIAAGDGEAQLTRMRIHAQGDNLPAAIVDLQQGSEKLRQAKGLLHGWVALYSGLEELKLPEAQPETTLQLLVEAHDPERIGSAGKQDAVEESLKSTLETQRGQLIYRALQTLQANKTTGVMATILAAANLCTTPQLEEQAIRTVTELADADDKQILDAALRTGEVPTRMAAAEGLLKLFEDRSADIAQTLMADASDRVQLRGAAVLANRGDRKVLSALVGFLDSESLNVRVQASAILRAYTKQNFRFTAYEKPEARAEVVAKWKHWVETEGQTAELSFPIRFGRDLRGRTLYTNYNSSLIEELDETNKQVWQRTGISGPWACQGLPSGNRLVSSYRNRSLHEFDENGKEVWKLDGLAGNPFSVQRLDNGNTLVSVSNNRIYEYTPEGKIAWEASFSGIPRSAQRLDNGNTLVSLYSSNEVVEIDPKKNVVWRAANMYSPITAQRLPNGHTVVGQYNTRRIVELDASGNAVWTHQWDNPLYDVQRLPTGNTLVVDTNGLKEIDRDGKILFQKLQPGIRCVSRY